MGQQREGLIQRRKQLGFSQESAAQAIGVSTSTYGSWERGTNECQPGFRPYIARLFKVSLAEVHEWFDGKPSLPDGLEVPSWLGHFATLEQGADHVQTYQPVVVPGLLQTRDYAAAIQRDDAVNGSPSDAEIERWVQVRLARQQVLDRKPRPVRLAVVLDESVLLRVFGDRTVMAGQLRHLAEAATRPNIDLRITTLAQATAVAAFGSFIVLTSPGSVTPFMACIFDRGATHYLERPAQIVEHTQLFRYLQERALSCDLSRDFILSVVQERYDP